MSTTNDWLRGIVTPIIVAVIVGLVSGYMASNNALAVHEEQLKAVGSRVDKVDTRLDKVEGRVDTLSEMRVTLARMEAEMAGVRASQARLEQKIDAK